MDPNSAVIEETTIVVAAKNLAQGTVIDRDAVETRQMPLKDVPQGSVGDPTEAFDKILVAPIKKGEPLLRAIFARNLGEAVPKGKMLVDVSIEGSAASLYVPCKVNVMWTSSPMPGEEAESEMLFSGVSVWGIGDRTIVSPDGAVVARRSSGRNQTVLLLVDLEQAQEIKAAMNSGGIWLALCNPSDIWLVPETNEPEAPQPDPEPVEEWEVLQINGGEEERLIWVKEGDFWRLREKPK